MNMNVKLAGIPEKIIEGAIGAGLAKTKTDAIVLGLIELDHKYRLLEKLEDEEDVRESRRITREVGEGRQKLYSVEEFGKETGLKIGLEKKLGARKRIIP